MRKIRTADVLLIAALFAMPAIGCQESSDGTDASTDTDSTSDTGISTEPDQHRAEAGECGISFAAEPVFDTESDSWTDNNCLAHADCTVGPHGICILKDNGSTGGQYLTCVYDWCNTDVDCPTNSVCVCDDLGSYCTLSGNCRVDGDCGVNGFCSPVWEGGCGYGGSIIQGYFCHTSGDECLSSSDCPGDDFDNMQDYCGYDLVEGVWNCQQKMICGGIG